MIDGRATRLRLQEARRRSLNDLRRAKATPAMPMPNSASVIGSGVLPVLPVTVTRYGYGPNAELHPLGQPA